MRKKLFWALLSLGIVLSSGTAYASEPEELSFENPSRIALFDEVYEYDEENGRMVLTGRNVVDDELVGAEEELPQIDAPTEARWQEKTGNLLFNASVNGTGFYGYSIYKEGEENPVYTGSIHYPADYQNTELEMGLSEDALSKMDSGRYYFTVYAKGNEGYMDSEACKSDMLDYSRPEKKLSIPSNLKWDKTVATWTLSEESAFAYELECKEEGSEEWRWAASGFYHRRESRKVERYDFTKDMNVKGVYRFRILAMSNDIFEAVDSEWSEWSTEISSEEFTSPVAAELRDLLDSNAGADEILNVLEKEDQKELALSVQTDPVIRNTMGEAEKRFSEEKGISVKTDVASDMADKISGGISVLGAAFNAGDDVKNMTLNITKPTLEKEVDRQQYKNVVQINMTLDGAADTQKLKVPVRITMPIPEGVSEQDLQILHYHNDGSYETIWPYISGKTASFTLTSFSTFIFANTNNAGAGDLPFTDVPSGWRYDNIKFVFDRGIMTGLDETTFEPDAPLNRAQFASVIYRLAGEPEVIFKDTFSDVPAGKWFSEAVIWANENGIVAGPGDGTYGPYANITREQMARMLMEFARVQSYNTDEREDFAKFADASQVSRWATDYMRWAVGSGIISGSTKDGKYYMNPKGQATRAECAVMLTKFIQKYQ